MGNPFGNGSGGNKFGGGGAMGSIPKPGDAGGGTLPDLPRPPATQQTGGPEHAQQVPAGGTLPFNDPPTGPGVPQVAGNGPKPFKLGA